MDFTWISSRFTHPTEEIKYSGPRKKVNNKTGKKRRKGKVTGKITDQNETTTINKVTLSK